MRRTTPATQGFTLIEVMVALAIFASMTTLIWGSFSLTANSKRKIEEIEDRYHQLRLGMNRIAREISMAYLSKNDAPGAIQPRTMFIGQRNSRIDDLTFSSLAHIVLHENAKECDQSVIRYFAAADPNDRKRTHLMRRESRRLGGQRTGEEGPAYIVIEDVEALHLQYFDEPANEWKETWNTTSADGQPDRLPKKVRIALTVRDETGREITFVSGAVVPMRDPLWFSTGQ